MFGGGLLPLLIASLVVVWGQELHGVGSEIKVECSDAATLLHFKLKNRFTLVLQSSQQEKVEVTLQNKGAAQCTLSLQSPICEFRGAETELFMSCQIAT